jgi:hypothetical protein
MKVETKTGSSVIDDGGVFPAPSPENAAREKRKFGFGRGLG